ncbi:MAG TPA: hypothetical protein ENJ37_04425 [Deltaproteobacteria bacterium]|nr:hypothetical protein [Deltaproteobacteria bacterium]
MSGSATTARGADAMEEKNWEEIVHKLKKEISDLAEYVDKTRRGVDDVAMTVKVGAETIPDTSDRIKSVTDGLEDAANRIMGILEGAMREQDRIQGLLAVLKDWAAALPEKDGREGLGIIDVLESMTGKTKENMMDIFTSLSFHDLSGQQLRKIMKSIAEVESRILALGLSFGIEVDKDEEKEDLLNKLQGSSESLDQDVVDRILKELGA